MFTQKPTKGLINPCASQLFVVKFMPIDESVLYKTVLPLRLNDADKHTQVCWIRIFLFSFLIMRPT